MRCIVNSYNNRQCLLELTLFISSLHPTLPTHGKRIFSSHFASIWRKLCKQGWSSKANQIKSSLPYPPLQRIILVLANVKPFCSKFSTSSKGSTITFPLLPTVCHSWIAKANLCCDFSFARSLPSIFNFVSRSSWKPHHSVGSMVLLGHRPWEGPCSPATKRPLDQPWGHGKTLSLNISFSLI